MDKKKIIDGIDVSECIFHQIEANELYPKAHYCGSIKNTFCENDPNCYYKQLARKTQECEDLKLCLQQSKDNNKSTLKLLENKHKALKEIEELVTPVANKNPVYNCWELLNKCDKCKSKKDCGAQSPYYVAKQVLDIINKAKEEK